MGAGEKKREILDPPPFAPPSEPHPSGPPTLPAPHSFGLHSCGPDTSCGGPPGPHFFWVWAPTFLILSYYSFFTFLIVSFSCHFFFFFEIFTFLSIFFDFFHFFKLWRRGGSKPKPQTSYSPPSPLPPHHPPKPQTSWRFGEGGGLLLPQTQTPPPPSPPHSLETSVGGSMRLRTDRFPRR